MILLDAREPRNIQMVVMSRFSNRCAVSVCQLPAGDIAYLSRSGRRLLIERKSAPDLLNSISDGRLYDECARLREHSDIPVLLVHGSILPGRDDLVIADGISTRWKWWSVQMVLFSLQTGGIIIMQVRNSDFVDALEHIFDWAERDEHLQVKPAYTPFGKPPVQIAVLSALPGIGPERARRIIERFGSLRKSLEQIEAWVEVPGIGPATVHRVIEALDDTWCRKEDQEPVSEAQDRAG